MAVQRLGPPGSIRVACSGTIGNEAYANVFWCNTVGGTSATQADLDGWTNKFATAYGTQLTSMMPTTVTHNKTLATLFLAQPLALHSVDSTVHAGFHPGTPMLEFSASKVISWRSQVYWKGGKPRTYCPGIVTSDTTDGKTFTATTVGDIANAANAFHGQVNGIVQGAITSTVHGFVSFRGLVGDIQVGAFFPILGAAAHPRIGSQRRRLGPWIP